MKKNKTLLAWAAIAAVTGIAIGLAVGYLVGAGPSSSPVNPAQVRANLSEYKFINPPLYSDGPSETTQPYLSFKSSLGSYVALAEKSGKASDVSVYFRDLNTGNWTGVNENDLYRPSSMLKVLNMMSALVIAQGEPGFLGTKLPYEATDHSDQYYKPAHTLSTGDHTVQELINAMIIDSDNDALHSLDTDTHLSDTFDFLYSLFRLPVASSTDFMSPKSYSALFRVLYNSSLFPWDLSEQVLDLLTHTSFNSGIVAGVPEGTAVAHKFGENTAVTTEGNIVERELHDCGIVYYPGHPYLVCIMTKGQDFSSLESAISDVSKMAYGFAKSQAGN